MVFLPSLCSVAWQGDVSPPAPSQRLDPAIQKVVSEISEENIAATLKKLEGFGTRNTLSDANDPARGIGAARQWIFEQLKSYSPRLEVSFDTHMIPKGGRVWKEVELRNVMAVLKGKQDPERWILVTGHYDSLNLRIPPEMRGDQEKMANIVAPGVTDNGSGTACVMECARVMSRYEFGATLVFVALAGEEQGLIGARELAKLLHGKNQAVEAVLNADTIGSDVSGNGIGENHRIMVYSEDPNDSPSRQVARFIRLVGGRYYPEMQVDLVFRHDRFGRGGDHSAFNQEGYPAVRFTTPNENFENQHSPTDTFANASPPYTTRGVRLIAAAAAAMARAPRPPVTMRAPGAANPARTAAPGAAASAGGEQMPQGYSRPAQTGPGITRGSGYDAVLRWDYPNPGPDLAGFIVVIRSTIAPDWEREIWAGNVREFTIKNLPIDHVVLGVKSLDKEGHESPVSAYWTQPRRIEQ
jgi:hypothetical protein